MRFINNKSAVAGNYEDGNGAYHGFVRTSDGKVQSFDAPGNAHGTVAYGINDEGTVAGTWEDFNTGAFKGFVRTADGAITTFNPTGSTGTSVTAIDAGGAIAGFYSDNGNRNHGFVRSAAGKISPVDISKSTGTFAEGLNAKGAITGSYHDFQGVYHGFVRSR